MRFVFQAAGAWEEHSGIERANFTNSATESEADMGLRNTKTLLSLIGFAAAVMVATNAKADPIGGGYTFDGQEVKATYGYSLGQGVNAYTQVANYSGQTVKFNWTRNSNYTADNDWGGAGDTLEPQRGTSFDTFCIQLGEFVGNGVFHAQTLASAPTLQGDATDKAYRALLIQSLWADYYALATTTSNVSALQIAIWEAVYETTKDVNGKLVLNATSGSAYFTGGNTVAANAELVTASNDVYVNPGGAIFANVWALVDSQDQVFVTDAKTEGVVPLPATAASVIGLLGAAALRRRRN
jgi:hypothetical protein